MYNMYIFILYQTMKLMVGVGGMKVLSINWKFSSHRIVDLNSINNMMMIKGFRSSSMYLIY